MMAGFSANDELVSKPSSVSWGSSDEPVTTTSTTPTVEGKGGAAFGVYPKAGVNQDPVSRLATHVGRTGAEAVVPTGAGLAGFGAGMAMAAPVAATVAPLTGPFAPFVAGAIELGGGFGGAMAASGSAKWMQDLMHKTFAPEDFAQREAEKKEYPTATFLTELGVGMAGMSPKTAATVAKEGAGKIARLASTPAGQRVVSGGLQGGIEAGTELAGEGKIEPWKVATATAAGAAMPGFNVAGKIPFSVGTKIGEKISDKLRGIKPTTTTVDPLPPRPPEGATAEEKAAYIQKLEAIKAERDAKAPLVEAAIRNKETGAIERMGPKHDEQRKAETIDTHDQGFVTERGQFLTREQAVEHAVNTGQLPKDYVLDLPNEGLHSGDLRAYGDERFKITEEQPPGVPKDQTPPADTTVTEKPTENKDYYREQLAALEKQKSEALNEIVWADKNNDKEYGDKMRQTLSDILKDMGKQQSLLDAADKGRTDFKKAIEDNEYKRLELEFEAEKAADIGNEERVTSINEQIKQLEAEHAQLHKDLPAVKFKDSRKPTWEELQDHLWGAKTIGEALDRILATKELGSFGQRILMKAINESNFIRSARLEFDKDYLKYTDKNGVEKQDAMGLYTGGDYHLVQMGKDGDVQTLLHEAVHAGTQRLLSEQGSAAAIKMQELFDKYKASHGDGSYGFTDVHEFAAEAFTNKEFQRLLADIQVGQQPKGVANNMWGAFKETVRKGLGVPEGARTAFDEVMDQGISLIKQSKDYTPRPDFVPTTSPSKQPSSPDELPVDRTKTDPRDVKNEKEFYEIATDIYEKHGPTEATRFYEGYQEYKQTWLEPIKETEKFVGINIKNKLANDRIIHNEMGKMQEAVPDPARREAIAEAVDKGDLSGLSPEEVAVAKQYESLVKDIGDRAVESGVVKGLLEDYVTHILDWAGAPKGAREEFIQSLLGTGKSDPAMGGMTTESKFGKERKFKTFADLEWYIRDVNDRIAAAGKSDWRLQLKTKDISQIYKEYATSMEKAIENKNLVDNLKQVRNVNGETLIKEVNKDNPMPYGWQMMDSPQFAGYAVHPDMLPALKFVFDAGPGDLMKALGFISQVTKRINVIGSFFHAKSLMEVLSSAQIPIWTPLKEAIVLPLIEKGIKAATGKDLQLSAISKAVEQYKNGGVGDNVDMWIKEGGLQLELPEDVTKGLLSVTGKFADSMIGKYGPKTRILESAMSTVEKYTLGLFDKYTWDYLHTGGKIMVADAYLDRARIQAAKEGKPFDQAASRKEIAKFVNDSFGGLNWFDAATQTQNEFAKRIAMSAYSPEGRRGLQVMLFAPDWTISTIRAFTAALPKSLDVAGGVKGMLSPATKSDYARLYQFKTALTYLTLINAINMMTAGRPVWENKDPTRVEFPDGTSMQAMKHAMEPYHWIMDPDKTLANKLGFIPKAAIIGIAGTEYASPQAQKLVDPSATGRLKAIAGTVVPFQVAASRDAPPGEGAKRALLGTMGFPLYGSTAEEKKSKRAERELTLKEKAWEYRDKEIKAGRMPKTDKHTQEGNTLRRRREKLDKKAGKE
jgi:hypothetical protein